MNWMPKLIYGKGSWQRMVSSLWQFVNGLTSSTQIRFVARSVKAITAQPLVSYSY